MKKRWIAIALLTVLLMGIGGAIGKVGVRQESGGSAYSLYFVERDLRSADGGDALRSEERTLEDSGLSTEELAAALVGQLRPAAVVCVDSLCSAEGQRLGRTVQFSDTGLYPAQADHTRHLTRDTLGVPVVAAGIPTLMQAQEGADLVVTPRALDSVIAHGAALLAGSVNRALQPRLTVQQLCWLTG